MASSMKYGGTIASIGMAAGTGLNTTVMPFILRAVSLLGVDSGGVRGPLRSRIWQRMGGDLRPRQLLEMTRMIRFDELPDAFDAFVQGKVRGRVVVEVAGV
jgi:NADPH:quinone reductase-like Zn-dependent oxidoreductase